EDWAQPVMPVAGRTGARVAARPPQALVRTISGQKKARPESRADKGLEIFSVNEKVCFGKQKPQYNELTPFH
ncbi:hypothetical protein, partial [Burkholderia pseudomallei]|uniref:hypothetical protein n=1 Tax=Burkholderia pseudomallei TaxID=28450 RepID=UPI001E650D10